MSTQLTATIVTLLALPGAAFAQEGPDLHVGTDHESCYFDLHPELTESEFREWAAEGGQIVRSRQLSGADTLGRGGLDVSIGYAYFFLDDTKGAWNNTMSHPNGDHPLGSQLGFPQLSLRVGVHRNVDAEVYGALNWNSNYGFVGIASKIRLLRQSEDMPISVSVRPSLSALAGPSEVQLVNLSADVAVSRSFHGVTPFVGVTLSSTAVRETSPDTDVESQSTSRPLAFGGVEYSYKYLSVAAQAEISDLAAFGVRAGGRF